MNAPYLLLKNDEVAERILTLGNPKILIFANHITRLTEWRIASGTVKPTTKRQKRIKKGHNLNTPPFWKESRAQHCQTKRICGKKNVMKLTLDELAKKYIAGTMTDTDLEESGYEIHQVEALAETLKNSTNTEATPFKFGSTKTGIHHITSFNKFEV